VKLSGKYSGISLNHFLRDADRALTALDAFMEGGSFEAEALKIYTLNIHSVKSLLRSVGEMELSHVAASLEQAGRSADIKTIKTESEQFLVRLREIVKALKSEAAEKEAEGGGEIREDLAFLRVQLAAIQTACETYNKRDAENAIEALGKRPCSKQTKTFLSEIDLHILRGDFEDAARLAKKASAARGK